MLIANDDITKKSDLNGLYVLAGAKTAGKIKQGSVETLVSAIIGCSG